MHHLHHLHWQRGKALASSAMLVAWVALTTLAGATLPANANPAFEGRWEGTAQVPGTPLVVVLDLVVPASTTAVPRGWITLPGRGAKGVPLTASWLPDGRLRLDASAVFNAMGPPTPAPQLLLAAAPPAGASTGVTSAASRHLRGSFSLAGLDAPLALARSGAAQPEAERANSVLTAELNGQWRGHYQIGGVPREITLTLAPAGANAVIVGRRTSPVAFDGIQLGAHVLTLSSSTTQITLEGRLRRIQGASGSPLEIDVHYSQGPYEASFVLKKLSATANQEVKP